MLTEIEMNFRHLRNVALQGLSAVNIIVGPNNAGKTSIFRGIQTISNERKRRPDGDYLCLGARIYVPDDIWEQMGNGPRSTLDPPRHEGRGSGLAQWYIFNKMHTKLPYIGHGFGAESRVFQLTDSSIQIANRDGLLDSKPSWREFNLSTDGRVVSAATKAIRDLQHAATRTLDAWIRQTYFLWHRRKSRYEEELGAFHDKLDEEAEHMPGRLNHLLAKPEGGVIRDRLDGFMNAVVPGIGKIGIRHRSKDAKTTSISVVFSDSKAERTLEELGGGVEQILALALVLVGEGNAGAVFIEEPESHLHESAQRRLIEQVEEHRGARQLFIATHSPVFVNAFPGANVYRVVRSNGDNASIRPCVDKVNQRQVLNDLGVLPSSLTQTNCVIWVEGPTETRLVRHWLTLVAQDLKVHQHYEFAETGGSNLVSLASDLTPDDDRQLRDIMRICHRNFVICDKDAGVQAAVPAKTPVREISALVGEDHWITRGYEIEWYIPEAVVAAVWGESVGAHMSRYVDQDRPFYEALALSDVRGTKSAGDRKVQCAERIVSVNVDPGVWFAGETGQHLRSQIERVATFIREANQMVAPTTSAPIAANLSSPGTQAGSA